jgi:hypothetical protein
MRGNVIKATNGVCADNVDHAVKTFRGMRELDAQIEREWKLLEASDKVISFGFHIMLIPGPQRIVAI